MRKEVEYPGDETLDQGRFRFGELLGGAAMDGRWSGFDQRTGENVLISFRSELPCGPDLERCLRYSIPGIAPVRFIGPPDGHSLPQDLGQLGWRLAVVETVPGGEPLAASVPLVHADAVRLGLGLCNTIANWEKGGNITYGLAPETVYMQGAPGHRNYSGAVPRSLLLLGGDGMYAAYQHRDYRSPSCDTVDLVAGDALFIVALVLWFAIDAMHPYHVPVDSGQTHHNMWNDKRRPFLGPREFGRLLEAVLVADIDKRMKLDEFVHELTQLAQAWNLEQPVFPPPGLDVE